MKKLLTVSACFLAISAACAFAQEVKTPLSPSVQRSISVTGEASAQIEPDQAVLSLSLVSRDKDLKKAKQDNDAMVEKLVAITHEFSIPKEKLATSNLYIAPEYDYNNSTHKQDFTGYTVNRSIRITIDKLEIHEQLLSAIVDAKINQVNGIEFGLADPESHADALRVKAMENAKARAIALAQAAGAKLGQPITISMSDVIEQSPRPMPMMRMMAAAAAPSVAPSLPGMENLHETVSVTYGLE